MYSEQLKRVTISVKNKKMKLSNMYQSQNHPKINEHRRNSQSHFHTHKRTESNIFDKDMQTTDFAHTNKVSQTHGHTKDPKPLKDVKAFSKRDKEELSRDIYKIHTSSLIEELSSKPGYKHLHQNSQHGYHQRNPDHKLHLSELL